MRRAGWEGFVDDPLEREPDRSEAEHDADLYDHQEARIFQPARRSAREQARTERDAV